MSFNPSLNNKIVMIIGGSTGIGEALINKLLFNSTIKIVLLDNLMPSFVHQNLSFFKCDVNHKNSIKNAIKNSLKKFKKIDIAINNAGIGGEFNATHNYSFNNWKKVIDVNLTGVFLCMKYQLQHFVKNNSGTIINTASLFSIVGYPNDSAYVASKHGVVGLTKSAALEYAEYNIRINCVSPGFTKTPMTNNYNSEKRNALKNKHAMKRFANPNEIAEAIIWLASEASSFVTGHNLVVDGGYTIK